MKTVKAKILLITILIILIATAAVSFFFVMLYNSQKELLKGKAESTFLFDITALTDSNQSTEIALSAITEDTEKYIAGSFNAADKQTLTDRVRREKEKASAQGIAIFFDGDSLSGNEVLDFSDAVSSVTKNDIIAQIKDYSGDNEVFNAAPIKSGQQLLYSVCYQLKSENGQKYKCLFTYDINSLVLDLSEKLITTQSFMLIFDDAADYIYGLSGSVTKADATGKKASSLSWFDTAKLATSGDKINIYGKAHLIFKNEQVAGIGVFYCVPTSELNLDANKNFFLAEGILFATAIFLILIVSLTIKIYVKNPVEKAKEGLKKLQQGDFDFKDSKRGGDDIKEINSLLYDTADSLKLQMQNFEKQITQREFEKSVLDVSKSVQSSMMRKDFSEFEPRYDFEIFAKLFETSDARGDFYDAYLLNDEKLFIMTGDVSGRGIGSAMYMATVKTLIKTLMTDKTDLATLMAAVNNRLYDDYSDSEMFASVFVTVINLKTGIMEFVNAGHTSFVKIPEGGKPFVVKSRADVVLGAFENTEYFVYTLELFKGDKLFLYTDGVLKSKNKQGIRFTTDDLCGVLNKMKSLKAKDIVVQLKQDINHFKDSGIYDDDLVLLCFEYKSVPDYEKDLTVVCAMESLGEVLEFINKPMVKAGFPEKDIMQVSLAVEELFVNIATYAYNKTKLKTHEWDAPDRNSLTINKKGHVNVFYTLMNNPDKIVIRFEDNGNMFNPLDSEEKEFSEEGGMGISIVKNVASYINYERNKGKNILTLTKLKSR